jgi:hypothetical protein
VNNEGSSFAAEFYLDEVLRSTNPKSLAKYNSFCPTLLDKMFGVYSDGVGTNLNVLASGSNIDYDSTFVPRGATPNITFLQIDRYNAVVGGVYQDNSFTSTATTDLFKVSIQLDTTEPIIGLAPFDWENSDQNKGGLLGLNNLNIQFTMDTSCSRVFSTAQTTVGATSLTSYITSISMGLNQYVAGTPLINTNSIAAQIASGFTEPKLLMTWYTPSSEQLLKIGSTKNCHSYCEYTPYITQPNTSIAAPTVVAGKTTYTSKQLTSNSIQMSNIPSRIYVFARVPVGTTNYWNYAKGYLTITGITVQFNNRPGILSDANQQQLWKTSCKNGSKQSWEEFKGFIAKVNLTTGGVNLVPSIGSLLVLDPTRDFNLPSFLSNGSTGQFNMQIQLTVQNQYPFSITPDLLVVTETDGIFEIDNGNAKKYLGNVDKTVVLEAKSKTGESISSSEFSSLSGGMVSSKIGIVRRLHKKRMHKRIGMVLSGGSMPTIRETSNGNRLQRLTRQ